MTKSKLLDGKEILIVDDEPDVLETLEGLLEMCRVTKASSFQEARGLLETRDFDMAILDIMGVDGYELLRIANEKKVIAVMLTAHSLSTESTVKSYHEGAAFFVPKDEMAHITTFLTDVLEAHEKGQDHWSSWLHRLGPFYDKRFGSDWKERDKEFWQKLEDQGWRLESVLRREEDR